MPPTNEGFTIPARVVVSVEGLPDVRKQLQQFVSQTTQARAVGQRPIDPETGAQATVKRMREETGASLNAARQAALVARTELQRTDLSQSKRRKLEKELELLKDIEKQLIKNSRAEGGRFAAPIYPEGQLRYPKISDIEKGVQPKFPAPRALPPIPQPAPAAPAPAPTPPTTRTTPRQRGGVKSTEAEAEETALEKQLGRATAKITELRDLQGEPGLKTLRAEQELAKETAQLSALRARLQANDKEYLKATAEVTAARKDERARTELLAGGRDPGDLSGEALRVKAAMARRADRENERALALQRSTREEIDAAAREKVQQRQFDLKVRQREAALVREGVQRGEFGKGTLFQQLQNMLSPASGRLPEENLKALQFVGDKLQRSIGYAASGALIGIASVAVAELFRDATKLEVTFVRLRGQLEGIGQANAFEQVRTQIRSIAAETGQASADVADFFARMLGISRDPAKAMTDTASAMKLMTVTGLSMANALSALIPIASSFGVTVEEIGDIVVTMGEKFGIAEGDFVQFLGKTSVVARQAGFSLNEVAIIGANMANSLGKPIESASESFNKITGQLELNANKIFAILQANPQTEPAIPKMIEKMAQGDPGKALIELLKVVDKFSPGQRSAILTNVVSRREAEDFNAMITNAGAILNDLQAEQDGTSASTGRLQQRFGDLRETVQITLQSLNAAFESLGEILLRLGIDDAIRDVANGLSVIVGIAGALASAFASLNESIKIFGMGDILTGLGRFIIVIGAVGVAQERLNKSRGTGVIIGRAESAAETENTTQKAANATATEGAAVAQTELNAARTAEAAALPPMLARGPVAGAAGAAAITASQAASAREAAALAAGAVPTAPPMLAGYAEAGLIGAVSARNVTRSAGIEAAEAALLAQGFGGRARRILPAFGEKYRIKLADYEVALNDIKKAGGSVRMSTLERSLAGGKFLKVPAADAMAEASRAATGLMSSPLLTGAIVLVAAGYAKSEYDKLKAQAQQDNAMLIQQLRQATDESVADVAAYRESLSESFIARITGTETISQLGRDEQAFLESREMRLRQGAAVRPPIKPKMGETTERYVKTTQDQINKARAQYYTADAREKIQEKLMETALGKKIGIETGTLSGPNALDQFLTWGGLFFDAANKRPEATNVDFAKLKSQLQTYQEGGRVPQDVTDILADIDKIEAGLPVDDTLNVAQRALQASKDASGLVSLWEGDVGGAMGAMDAWGNDSFKSINELNAQYRAGAISEAEYLRGTDEALTNIKLAGQAMFGPEAEANRIFVLDTFKAEQELFYQSRITYADFASKLAEVTSLAPKRAARDLNLKALEGAPFEIRKQALPQMLQRDLEAGQEALESIPNPTDRLNAMVRGYEVSALTFQTSIETQIRRTPAAEEQIKQIANLAGKQPGEVLQLIIDRAREQGLSFEEAAKQVSYELGAQWRNYGQELVESSGMWSNLAVVQGQELMDRAGEFATSFRSIQVPSGLPEAATAQLKAINMATKTDQALTAKAMGGATGNTLAQASIQAGAAARNLARVREARSVKDSKVLDEDVWMAEGELDAANISYADAFFNYQQLVRRRQVVLADRDPVLENAASMAMAVAARDRARAMGRKDEQEQAEQQILELQFQARDNQLDIVRGAMAIQAARDAEDPYASAADALRAAEFELANAHGEADREQKQAAVIQAQKNLNNAISAGIAADAQLAVTLANLRDDPVTAANLALQEAQRRLDEAVGKGIKDRSVLAPLEQQIAESAKAAFLAPINKQIEDLDFLYGMEQIALGEYIAGLEAQLSRLSVNSREYRDLALKIHNLKKQSEQDFQFNLPTTLGLPTLYEARRVTQSGQMGIGYQDNRNIAMVINVNGAQDPMAITSQIVSALSAASGVTKTPLAGVGF